MYLKTVSTGQCSILSLSELEICLGALLVPDFPLKDERDALSSSHFSAGVELLFFLHFFSSSMDTG